MAFKAEKLTFKIPALAADRFIIIVSKRQLITIIIKMRLISKLCTLTNLKSLGGKRSIRVD